MKTIIDYNEILKKNEKDYVIIDIRSKYSYDYGHIPGALSCEETQIEQDINEKYKDKEIYLYCKGGEKSRRLAEALQKSGIKAYSFDGGYSAWCKKYAKGGESEKAKALAVEQSIRQKFHRCLFSKFCKAIKQYELIKPNDKIAVCISGGKDSMLMAKLFQEIKRQKKMPFELIFLVMDPGYNKKNREQIEKNAELLNIPITIFETRIFDHVFNIENNPCYICARMRRGHLYNKAKQLGCNKIALGHHYDDVIETILMSMLYGSQIQTMMPKVKSENFENMQLIRPLYFIREADIIKWRDYNNLKFIQCACKFTEENHLEVTSSKRKRVKDLIAELKKEDKEVDYHIFRSVENVSLASIIEYKDKNGIRHNFLDDYDNFGGNDEL